LGLDIFTQLEKITVKDVINSSLNIDLNVFIQSHHYNKGGIISNINEGSFNIKNLLGSLLKEPNDRFKFYVNKSKSKLKYKINMEIIMQYKKINTNNYTNLISKTYEDCAKSIIMSFMSSEPHKESVIFEMDDFGKMHGEYKSYYNSKTDCLTTTGFFVLVFGDQKGKICKITYDDF
jgi:hypothetical protein